MSSFSTTRRLACVAGDDRDLHAVQAELLEAVPQHDDDRLGRVALARVRLVDPVADVRVLERAPLHRVEVDLAGELAVDEDPEPVAGAELPLALAGAAPHGERLAVLDARSGVPGMRIGSHLSEPVAVAPSHLAPLHEVADRPAGAASTAPPEQADHRGQTALRARRAAA